MTAVAGVGANGRIVVQTVVDGGMDFDQLLAASKRVGGCRFAKRPAPHWHYPLSLDTCLQLRRAFGSELKITRELADWYRAESVVTQGQRELAVATDAPLSRVPQEFTSWLRPYQRSGAAWIARGYRDAGLVADTPGVGKTGEMLAGLLEAGITGPVLVVCPKPSVRLVWGKEIADHLPDVPTYLCYGSRARRQKVLDQFADDLTEDWRRGEDPLRIVVVVAEMLRVEMGDPCYTRGGNKIHGMCPNLLKNGVCLNHVGQAYASVKERKKDQVPVAFSFPILFAGHLGPERRWSAIVLDESHKMLGSLTITKGNLMGRGLRLLPLRQDVRRYAMSGTPFGKGGRVQGMFGTLNYLWPDEFTGYWRWAGDNFEIEEKEIGRGRPPVKKVVGLKGLSPNASEEERAEAMERFLRTLGPRILRRTKAEVLPDLPPKAYYEVPCAMTAKQARQYKALAEYAEVKTSGGMVVPNGGLALLMRERQIANGEITVSGGTVRFTGESGKLDRLWEKLDAHGILDGAPGTKIVIASEFNQFLDVIQARLLADKIPHFRIDGSTPEARRDKIVECWQQNIPVPRGASVTTIHDRSGRHVTAAIGESPRVLIVNSVAAGISITLDAADEMHIMDERWNPEENEQLEDRIHRASNLEHKVSIWYYRTEGTIDYAKAHSVEMKRRAQHAVLDGARGLAYLREMMSDAFEGVEVES